MKLRLTKAEAERLCRALNGPSSTDPVLAKIYERLVKELER